jgi:hypothetical protein
MNIKSIRTMTVLASILMTLAMLASVRAGFQAPPISVQHVLAR